MVSFASISALILISKQIFIHAEQCEDGDPIACYNEGFCVNGEKDYEDIFQTKHVGMVTRSKRGMFCRCPDEHPNDFPDIEGGYSGVHCDTPFVRCGDGSVCFNSGFCERDSGNANKYHCGCPMDGQDQVWTGRTCELKPTSYCSESDPFYDLAGSRWFCTNDGNCVDGETDLAKKCECPDGFKGIHCELEDKEPVTTSVCSETDTYTELTGSRFYCMNGGSCIDGELDINKKCDCELGYSGARCEIDEAEVCELTCFNGGMCTKGAKDLSTFVDSGLDIDHFLGGSNVEGEYCVCPEGFYGVQCQLEETINGIESCGGGVCFNGGLCVEKEDLSGEFLDYHCECNEFETGIAGEFCEHIDVNWCPFPEGHDGTKYYCANGGDCPDAQRTHEGCKNCDPGWTGTRCETREANKEVVDERNDCDLDCRNGGECFFGDHPVEDESVKTIPGLEFLQDNKHCRCPEGYIGLRCEMRYERCGAGEHYCLHGSGCVSDNDEFTCDCNEVSTTLVAYAGHYCEHTATEFCQGPGAGKHSFCTNNGKCRGQVGFGQDHVGCDCDEGWTGEYCEYQVDQLRTNGIATQIFIGFIVGLIFFVITISVVCCVRRRSKSSVAYHSAPVQETHANPYGDENDSDDDEDEYELKEVTII